MAIVEDATTPTGRAPMTRAEAARHASLVRWGKEQPLSFQQRLAAVQERRKLAKQKAGKGKAKASAKPKRTPEQRTAERQAARAKQKAANKASVQQQMADNDTGLAPKGFDNLMALGDGAEPDTLGADGLVKMGMAERGQDGTLRLTPEGRATIAAAERGDYKEAVDAVSRGSDRVATQGARAQAKETAAQQRQQKQTARQQAQAQRQAEKEKAQKEKAKAGGGKQPQQRAAASAAQDRAERAQRIAGRVQDLALARGAAGAAVSDRQLAELADAGLVELHGTAATLTEAGAARIGGRAGQPIGTPPAGQDRTAQNGPTEDAPAQEKGPTAQAMQEAAQAGAQVTQRARRQSKRHQRRRQSTIANLTATVTEGKAMENLLAQLETIADALTDEGDAAIKAGARNSAADQERIQQIYEAAEDICELAEALGADTGMDEDEDTADEANAAPDEGGEVEMMAGKAQRTFGGKERADLDESDFAGPGRTFPIMTAQDVQDAARLVGKADDPEAVKRKIIAIAKRKGLADALPEAWQAETKKSIDIETVCGSAIKALDGNTIGGFGVLFGDADTPDLSMQRDFFTKATDYWLDKFGWPRPITYHHGMDEDTRDDPIIGSWTKAVVKDEGIWLEGQLDRSYKYHNAIKELIRRGALKLSSDSAPQWVIRERQPNGANEVKRWPLITASTTVTPAEPRMAGLAFKSLLAELGLEDIADSPEANDDEPQRHDGAKADQERARRLALEIDLELEDIAV